jgi:hypothetical protein
MTATHGMGSYDSCCLLMYLEHLSDALHLPCAGGQELTGAVDEVGGAADAQHAHTARPIAARAAGSMHRLCT